MLAPILQSMDARVITDLKPDPELPHAFRELPQLVREADIVSLHVPLTATTANLIDRRRLAMMRPGAILINTARGGLVDQAALLDALKSGHLCAVEHVDVFATEPVAPPMRHCCSLTTWWSRRIWPGSPPAPWIEA